MGLNKIPFQATLVIPNVFYVEMKIIPQFESKAADLLLNF